MFVVAGTLYVLFFLLGMNLEEKKEKKTGEEHQNGVWLLRGNASSGAPQTGAARCEGSFSILFRSGAVVWGGSRFTTVTVPGRPVRAGAFLHDRRWADGRMWFVPVPTLRRVMGGSPFRVRLNRHRDPEIVIGAHRQTLRRVCRYPSWVTVSLGRVRGGSWRSWTLQESVAVESVARRRSQKGVRVELELVGGGAAFIRDQCSSRHFRILPGA